MTKREIAALVCKALGIYTFIGVVNMAPWLLASVANFNPSPPPPFGLMPSFAVRGLIISVMPAAVNLLIGWFLLARPDYLARRMVPEETDSDAPIIIGEGIETLVFSSLGLFALLQAIPRLGRMAMSLVLLSHYSDDIIQQPYPALGLAEAAGTIVQFGLGLWLLLGASGVVAWVKSYRTVGMDREISASPETRSS